MTAIWACQLKGSEVSVAVPTKEGSVAQCPMVGSQEWAAADIWNKYLRPHFLPASPHRQLSYPERLGVRFRADQC